jgi:CheY-like chemotaxis protein
MTRVLVVEDDGLLAELLREALREEGYDVRTAAGAAEAYVSVLERWPDIMLLDVHLPGMDGWTFLGACDQDPWAARLPVVMMSPPRPGWAEDGSRVAFLPKPFDLDDLARTVEQLVAARRSGSPARGDRAGELVPTRLALRPDALVG